MKIRIAEDYDQMSTWAAELVAQQIKEKHNSVLLGDRLNTGRTVPPFGADVPGRKT